ncbi:trehalose-phosphatase [Candidatus Omnitrophota bacterium]
MKHLFEEWNKLEKKLEGKNIFLFLDYDGTLTPIVEHPDRALIPLEARELIRRLSKTPKCRLAIISGRSLKDLKRMVGIEKIIYAGNHGLEIEGPKIRFESPISAGARGAMKQVKSDLEKKLSKVNGVLVEDKGLTLSVHYRQADEDDIPLIKNIFTSNTQPYVTRRKIRITSGKKVFEVRPAAKWDKGKVVLWLLAREQFASVAQNLVPIYIGDDKTDEDAFKVIKDNGLTIFVGKLRKSSAKYYLKSTAEVINFLKRIRIMNLEKVKV